MTCVDVRIQIEVDIGRGAVIIEVAEPQQGATFELEDVSCEPDPAMA